VLTAARGMRAAPAPPCRMPCERPRQRAGRRPSSTAPPGTRCTAGRLARAPARSPPQSCCSPRCSSQRSARRACGPRARAPPPLRSWAALQRAQSGRRRVRTAPSPSQPGATRRYAGAHAAARHAAGRPPGPGPPAAPAQPGARPLMPLAPVHQVDRCGCLRQRRTVVVLSCSSGAGSRQQAASLQRFESSHLRHGLRKRSQHLHQDRLPIRPRSATSVWGPSQEREQWQDAVRQHTRQRRDGDCDVAHVLEQPAHVQARQACRSACSHAKAICVPDALPRRAMQLRPPWPQAHACPR